MFIVFLLKCRDIAKVINGDYWVGLTDEAKEGEWRWVNGELAMRNQTSWRNGEPNNAKNNENCGLFYSSDALINDVPCSLGFSGICEIDKVGQSADNNFKGKFTANNFLEKISKLEFCFNSN